MMKRFVKVKQIVGRIAFFVGLIVVIPSALGSDAKIDGEALLKQRCSGCHVENAQGELSRISGQRKTPEGWMMTLFRMQNMRGAFLSEAENVRLVKHLSDTQGLAPSEVEPYRYILEQRPNIVESWPEVDFRETCTRCHSGARVAVQRRSEIEWERLVNFHLGQYPAAEGTHRDGELGWMSIALGRTVPLLASRYPLKSSAWERWKAVKPKPLAGRWRLAGHRPGHGDFSGYLDITGGDGDAYAVSFSGQYINGEPMTGTGSALVYTGYEWRATLSINGELQQQVLALDEAGGAMDGRMFVANESARGTDVHLVREGSGAEIMGVYPSYVKAGTEAELLIVGTNLADELVLPAGVQLIREVSRSADQLRVKVSVDASIEPGKAMMAIGGAEAPLVTYRKVDALTVLPSYAIARLGGGHTPKVPGIFEAMAIGAGADGVVGTDDDIEIGRMPASWSVAPYDEIASQHHDVEFAGKIDAGSGIFTPANAGQNLARGKYVDNVGHLSVIAVVDDSGRKVSSKAELIVTVQKWTNHPIQ